MPKGPWESHATAKMELNQWASDFTTGGGRFNLVWTSTYRQTSRKGKQIMLSCYKSRKISLSIDIRMTVTQRTNCSYNIRIEDCVEGWAIAHANFFHNHSLVENNSGSLAQASLREFPLEFNSLGFELKRADLSATKINQVFISKAHDKKYPITWTYQDVYNRFQPSVEERSFDASNFIDFLQQRQSSKGLYFSVQMVEDGSLNAAFWAVTDSLERWAIS